MKIKHAAICFLSAFLVLGSFAADRLAIAEPINKGGMKPQDVEAVWAMLEATVDGGYELISEDPAVALSADSKEFTL